MEHSESFLDAWTWIPLAASLLVSAGAFVVMRFYLRAIFRGEQTQCVVGERLTLTLEEDRGLARRLSVGHLEIQVERPQWTARPTSSPVADLSTRGDGVSTSRGCLSPWRLDSCSDFSRAVDHTLATVVRVGIYNSRLVCRALLGVVLLHARHAWPCFVGPTGVFAAS